MGLEDPESAEMVEIILDGEFDQMNGTLMSIRGADGALVLSVEIYNNSQVL